MKFLLGFFVRYGFIDSTAEQGDRKQGGREGEWHAAKGPKPGSAAEPQHIHITNWAKRRPMSD